MRLKTYGLEGWVIARLEGREVVWTEDAVARLHGVQLVCLGDARLGLWRLADSYPAAQTKVLAVLPKLGAPVLSPGKSQPAAAAQPPSRPPQPMSCARARHPGILCPDGGT